MVALAAVLTVSTTRADLVRFIWNGAGDGVDFADPANWGGEAANGTNLPGDAVDTGAADASNVIMQMGGTPSTSVSAPFAPASPFDILIVRNGHTLNLTADFDLTGIPTLLGQTGTGSLLNLSAGTFTTAGVTVGGGADGTLNLLGTGSLVAAGISVNGNSTLRLSGSASTASATSLAVDSGSSLEFFFGPTGVNSVGLSGAFNITPGALLMVDGSGYLGGPGTIDLVSFSGNTGSFADPADITLNGFTGLNPTIGYDASRMFLSLTAIPEPSTWALLLVGGAALTLRRRR
jgi:hypothetical protein